MSCRVCMESLVRNKQDQMKLLRIASSSSPSAATSSVSSFFPSHFPSSSSSNADHRESDNGGNGGYSDGEIYSVSRDGSDPGSDSESGYGEFSRSDVDELLCQGIKPWDDEGFAADALDVLEY